MEMIRNPLNTRRRGTTKRTSIACLLSAAVTFLVGAGRLSADPTTLASGLNNPSDLQLYDGNLYFAVVSPSTNAWDTIMDTSTEGGTASIVLSGLSEYYSTSGGYYAGIGNYSVDSEGVFGDYGVGIEKTIFAGNPSTGATQILVPSSYAGSNYVGQSDGNVYYLNRAGQVNSISTSGGSSTVVATNAGFLVGHSVTDSSGVYFNNGFTQIHKFSYASQSVSVLSPNSSWKIWPQPFAVDDANLYLNMNGVIALPKVGGNPVQTLPAGDVGYAAANGNVFYTNGNTIEQYSVSAAKSIPLTTIAAGNVTSMATDGNWLYYGVSNGNNTGTINKVAVGVATVSTVNTPPPLFTTLPGQSSLEVLDKATGDFVPVSETPGTVGYVDATKSTVVLTHGFSDNPMARWGGTDGFAETLADAEPTANILAWNWSNNDGSSANALATLPAATWNTQQEGLTLATDLIHVLGAGYANSIHFYGHSLGTLVNAKAINTFYSHDQSAKIKDTLFDEAEIANTASGYILWQSSNFSALPKTDSTTAIDNYIAATGNVHPNAVNIILSQGATEFDPVAFHNYPVEWYQQTIENTSTSLLGMGFQFNGTQAQPGVYPYNFEQYIYPSPELSLSPITYQSAQDLITNRNIAEIASLGIQKAWSLGADLITGPIQYSGNVTAASIVLPLGLVETPSNSASQVDLQLTLAKGAASTDSVLAHRAEMATQQVTTVVPAYAWIPIAVPADADFMSFDFQMNNLSPGDFLSAGIDDTLLFQIQNQFIANSASTNSGLLDVSQWAGQDIQLFLGLNAADDANIGGTIVVDNISFEAVPEPSALLMMVVGTVGLWEYRRRVRRYQSCATGPF